MDMNEQEDLMMRLAEIREKHIVTITDTKNKQR